MDSRSGSQIPKRGAYKLWRGIAAHRRSAPADLALAITLAFIAGAINAGGFLAIGQYTSHMTGIVSTLADNIVLGYFNLLYVGVITLLFFIFGAACSAILINWGRKNTRTHQYVFPIFFEALLLVCFAIMGYYGANSAQNLNIMSPFLCFIMGLQNATITKISYARIRTTHLTGMMTDIGIEAGKIMYATFNKLRSTPNLVVIDRDKLAILSSIVGAFFAGGLIGAVGFGHFGFGFALPLAGILIMLSAPHIFRSAMVKLKYLSR